MNFLQLFLILKARYKIVLLAILVTVAAAVAATVLLPKTYKANSSLLLNYKGVDPVSGLSLPAQLMPGYTATQVDIISSPGVALKVVEALHLAQDKSVQQKFEEEAEGKGNVAEWVANLLLKKLKVVPSRESSVITLTFSDTDPQMAATIVNQFATTYQSVSNQLKVDPSRSAATYFNEQLRILRANLESAQNALSEYQKRNGIVSADNRADVESVRLSELSSQLVQVQTQVSDASSRRNQAMGNRALTSPEVISNTLVQRLKEQVSQSEYRLKGLLETVTENHPRYQVAKAEAAKLRAELNEQIALSSGGVSSNLSSLKDKETQIRAALEAQKLKVLDLNQKRDQVKLLNSEVERAQRAYETTAQRFTQINLEGQSTQSEAAVLNLATVPTVPAGPGLVLSVIIALSLGGLLGVGFATLTEMLDRRVRSEYDLIQSIDAPLFGTIVWGDARPQLRFGKLLSLR
jgi:succinoglycan biosynthesis transport protein ExoP